jgi:hypothetical protein
MIRDCMYDLINGVQCDICGVRGKGRKRYPLIIGTNDRICDTCFDIWYAGKTRYKDELRKLSLEKQNIPYTPCPPVG